MVDLKERVLARIQVSDTGCWEFCGARSSGYGTLRWTENGKSVKDYTHRIMYRCMVGPITHGLHIDHLCRNRACCNPQHLELVTQSENNQRAWDVRRPDTCGRGHPFTPENTGYTSHVTAHGRPTRRCIACGKERGRQAYLKRKAELRNLIGRGEHRD